MAQLHQAAHPAHAGSKDAVQGQFWALTLGSVGVAYGDIGTSPLYAFREAVMAAIGAGLPVERSVLEVLSLLLWSLLIIVTAKYVLILLRLDNKGEGGTFALMALGQTVAKRSAPIILVLGIGGASFFYGDAVLTPAISVLSAVEGLRLVAPVFDGIVVPATIAILFCLFWVQSHGTERVARFFGPIMVVWFIALAIGGLMHIVDDPRVFYAFNPIYGLQFIFNHGFIGLTVLGLVFLAVTGAEALYADLGHFGRKPIQAAWLGLVLPSLALNYLGQGALVLSRADAFEHTFYRLYPPWALIPMVVLATAATVIASQAVITGAFSMTRQAIQLGLLPRFAIRHTSESMAGQIYLPRINHMLLIGVVLVVLMFHSSGNLAAAYGVSVTATMVLDSAMAFFVIWQYWRWPLVRALALIAPFMIVEQGFFVANMLKVLEGGWFPLLIGGSVALIMVTWIRGSRLLVKSTRKNEAELDWLIRKLEAKPPHRVSGTAVFLTADPNFAPTSLLHNLKHNRVLHERNIILTLKTEEVPRVPRYERVSVENVSDSFVRVIARYGFMETPSIPKIFDVCRRKGLNVDMSATSFFLSRRSLRPTTKSEMPGWQDRLFIKLARSAEDATTYFQIPTDRVVEVGTQVAV
jgi:KUP system potassium uptake protein